MKNKDLGTKDLGTVFFVVHAHSGTGFDHSGTVFDHSGTVFFDLDNQMGTVFFVASRQANAMKWPQKIVRYVATEAHCVIWAKKVANNTIFLE